MNILGLLLGPFSNLATLWYPWGVTTHLDLPR